jgi:hypothetical protein
LSFDKLLIRGVWHEDLDLLLAEGMLPLLVLVDEVGGARQAAPQVVRDPGSPLGSPRAPSGPVRPDRPRPHHSYYDSSGCLRTIVPRAAIVLQKDHHDEIVDAEAGEAGQRRGARIPCKVSGASPLQGVAEPLRSHSRGSQRVLEVYSSVILKLVRSLVSPTSTSSMPPHVLVGDWCEGILFRTFPS